jgi:hypothetical protein
VSFAIGTCLVLLFIFKANDLIASGIDKMIFYVLLIPMGLSAAAFLFGAMRSYAAYSGKSFGGSIELGGPAALFALVVVGGFYLVPDTTTFGVTVYVHGSGGKQDVVLRNQGEVMIDFEDYRRPEPIRENGQATFPGIPAKFRNQVVPIVILAKGFEIADKNKQYEISGKAIYVEVRRDESLAKVFGKVKDEDKYLKGVQISIEDLQTMSDSNGYFMMSIPPAKQKKQQTLRAIKEGYTIYEAFVYPELNEEIKILLEKK